MFARGPQRRAAWHNRRAALNRPWGRAGPLPDRWRSIDSQTVPAADGATRSSRGWDGGKRTNGVKLGTSPWIADVVARRRRHRCLDPGPLGTTPNPGCTARPVLHHPAALGPTAVTPDGCSIRLEDVLTLTKRSSNASPAPLCILHVRPRIWVIERSFAWINNTAAARDYETTRRPRTTMTSDSPEEPPISRASSVVSDPARDPVVCGDCGEVGGSRAGAVTRIDGRSRSRW